MASWYTTYGQRDGQCEHQHRTASGAERCIERRIHRRDAYGRRQVSVTDRHVYRVIAEPGEAQRLVPLTAGY